MMTSQPTGDTAGDEVSYIDEVGRRLRRIRKQQDLSLQDVERESDGVWKAAVVGSYERGDRNISASRLCELAEFYGVSPAEILPADDMPAPMSRSEGIVIDLARLEALDAEPFPMLQRYCQSIQVQRGDYNRELLSVRADDLRAMAVMAATDVDELVDMLGGAGALRES